MAERLREKDEGLRQLREELQQKETQLQQKEVELQQRYADISRLQKQLQVCVLSYTYPTSLIIIYIFSIYFNILFCYLTDYAGVIRESKTTVWC